MRRASSAADLHVVSGVELGVVPGIGEPAEGRLDLVAAAPDGKGGVRVQAPGLVGDLCLHLLQTVSLGITEWN